jgi:hypothetical protein
VAVRCPACAELVVIPGPEVAAVPSPLPEINLAYASTDSRLDSLTARVAGLERSNARLQALTIAACVGCVVALGLAVSPPLPAPIPIPATPAPRPVAGGIVEMRGLVIRDEAGRIRATLGYEGDKSAGLTLYDPVGGKPVSDYKVLSNTDIAGVASLNFYYANGGEALNIGGGGGRSIEPGMEMYDAKGDVRVQFGILLEGSPNLSLLHSKLRSRFQVGIHGDGKPYMDFFDARDRILPMLDKTGVPLFYPQPK